MKRSVFKKITAILSSAVMTVSACAFTVNAAEKGDANGDGKVNVRDCSHIASMLAQGKGSSLPEEVDYNGDGKINIRDAAALSKALASGLPLKSSFNEYSVYDDKYSDSTVAGYLLETFSFDADNDGKTENIGRYGITGKKAESVVDGLIQGGSGVYSSSNSFYVVYKNGKAVHNEGPTWVNIDTFKNPMIIQIKGKYYIASWIGKFRMDGGMVYSLKSGYPDASIKVGYTSMHSSDSPIIDVYIGDSPATAEEYNNFIDSVKIIDVMGHSDSNEKMKIKTE